MKQTYTAAELQAQITALEGLFDSVTLIDPAAQRILDPNTMQLTDELSFGLPVLDETGRAWQPMRTGNGVRMALCQAITVDGRGCVLAASCALTGPDAEHLTRPGRAFSRLTGQFMEDIHRDYVTGVYNRRFLDEEYLPHLREQVWQGVPLSAAMVRVNEYSAILAQDGHDASDRCLTVAAGILQMAVDPETSMIARLDDGMFLVTALNTPAHELRDRLNDTVSHSRRVFGSSLSRRGEFTISLGVAEWAETRSWDMLLALAEHRLNGG